MSLLTGRRKTGKENLEESSEDLKQLLGGKKEGSPGLCSGVSQNCHHSLNAHSLNNDFNFFC